MSSYVDLVKGSWQPPASQTELLEHNETLVTEYAETIEQLQKERDELAARVERLERVIKGYLDSIPEHLIDEDFAKFHDVYNESPPVFHLLHDAEVLERLATKYHQPRYELLEPSAAVFEKEAAIHRKQAAEQARSK